MGSSAERATFEFLMRRDEASCLVECLHVLAEAGKSNGLGRHDSRCICCFAEDLTDAMKATSASRVTARITRRCWTALLYVSSHVRTAASLDAHPDTDEVAAADFTRLFLATVGRKGGAVHSRSSTEKRLHEEALGTSLEE